MRPALGFRRRRRHGSSIPAGVSRDKERSGRDQSSALLAQLVLALDALPIGVVVCDRDGQVVQRNSKATNLVGDYRTDALVDASVKAVVASAANHISKSEVLELSGHGVPIVSITAKPLADGGSIVVIEDISERRQLDAVRRDFVANVSHELRTPIGALALLAEALEDETDPEVIARLMGHITSEVRRASRLVEELLDLSRIEAGKLADFTDIEVDKLIGDVIGRVAPLAIQRGIQVTATPVDGSLVVSGDREELLSAIVNLLENAVKYSDGGTSIRITVEAQGTNLVIRVIDEGIGIPAKDLDRVFERFYRVDRARSRETGGAGLGLAIVRHVAANHGGEVTVESHEGEGSIFTLTIPLVSGTTDHRRNT